MLVHNPAPYKNSKTRNQYRQPKHKRTFHIGRAPGRLNRTHTTKPKGVIRNAQIPKQPRKSQGPQTRNAQTIPGTIPAKSTDKKGRLSSIEDKRTTTLTDKTVWPILTSQLANRLIILENFRRNSGIASFFFGAFGVLFLAEVAERFKGHENNLVAA